MALIMSGWVFLSIRMNNEHNQAFPLVIFHGIITPKYDNEVHTMKKLKELSLILSGVILGFGLSFSPQIYAATSSLLGNKVDKVIVVKLDKVEIGQAAIIDGVSLLPLRAISNALDVGVDYTSEEINLTSGGGATLNTADADTPLTKEQNAELARIQQEQSESETAKINKLNSDKRALEIKIKNKKEEIASAEYNIQDSQLRIDTYKKVSVENEKTRAEVQSEINRYQASIDSGKVIIITAEKELTDLEAQLAAIK